MTNIYNGIYNFTIPREKVVQQILDILSDGRPHRCGEIAAKIGVTCQRVSGLCRQLYMADKIDRYFIDGRTKIFNQHYAYTSRIDQIKVRESITVYTLKGVVLHAD